MARRHEFPDRSNAKVLGVILKCYLGLMALYVTLLAVAWLTW